ncbi:hypothetical protein [Mannheimia indoligenes]|uniref:hypothetical protein n=1 Tax=Mannheimia indoligenes TaxID=3103145 RepID=UPI002FE6BBB0
MIENAYAGQFTTNLKGRQIDSIKEQDNKPVFKISERKVLKALPVEEAVSSFSMEELRIGAQRVPDTAEIQYYKSQCRYAFMSDRDVIENRCETKRISSPK